MQQGKNNPEKLKFIAGELAGLRTVLTHLWDNEPQAFAALYFIKNNYKQWPDILRWLKRNDLRGKKLVEFFQNESADGGGYHLGVMHILSRLDGHKHEVKNVKADVLL